MQLYFEWSPNLFDLEPDDTNQLRFLFCLCFKAESTVSPLFLRGTATSYVH